MEQNGQPTSTNAAPVMAEQIGKWISDASVPLGLFPSVIKSGENWSSHCEDVRRRARVAIEKLGEVALASAPPCDGVEDVTIKNPAFEIARESISPTSGDRNKMAVEPAGYRERLRSFVDLVAPGAAERGAAAERAVLGRTRAAVDRTKLEDAIAAGYAAWSDCDSQHGMSATIAEYVLAALHAPPAKEG